MRYTLHSGVTEMWDAHKVCFGIARLHVNKYVPCRNSASVFLELIEQACQGKRIVRQLSYTYICYTMPLAKSNDLFDKCRCFVSLTRGKDIVSCMLPGFGDPRLRMKGAYIE